MPNAAVTEAINLAASGQDLTSDQAQNVLREIMSDSVEEVQTAAFLIALRTKGETVDELAGLASTMRELATRVDVPGDDLLDTAGTGGGTPTFNVSTTAAFIAAGAGCRVAKHGNRSATRLCGSADLLEALGARIDLPPAAVAQCIEEVGFGFMFAPQPPPGHEACGPGAKGARSADDLQLPGAPDQSGRRGAPADRCLRPALHGPDGGCARTRWAAGMRWWYRARTAWTR